MILDEIVENKRMEIRDKLAAVSIDVERRKAEKASQPLDFKKAIQRYGREKPKVIAEIKKQSPSTGVIAHKFNPGEIALGYVRGGAAAVSVLTDEKFFGGSAADLEAVRKVCPLPLIAKDFFIHPYQVYASRNQGADAVLLIARILGRRQLKEMYALVTELAMAALVEVHNEEDIERAAELGAEIIGINNRDLDNFSVSLKVTEKLVKLCPPGAVVVSESGIKTPEDMEYLEYLGVDAVLVGGALMRSSDPGRELEFLRGGTGNGAY